MNKIEINIKNFKFILFFLLFFQNFHFLASFANINTSNISQVSQPIILLAKSLIKKHKQENLPIPFISISGCSAVGKTQLAKGLCFEFEKIGIKAKIIQQDDFIITCRMPGRKLKHPFLNHNEIHRVINEVKNRKLHINMPQFDYKNYTTTYQELNLTDIDIILFEGLYVLNTDKPYNFNDYANIRIFIDATEENIIEWHWQRKKAFENKFCNPANKNIFNKNIIISMRDYHKNILPQKKKADLIIEKDSNHNYSLAINKFDMQNFK